MNLFIWFFKYVLAIFLSALYITSFAQKTVVSVGEYKMRVDDKTTWEEAKIRAIKLAEVNAIESAFGKAIIQNNSTYIQNIQKAESVKTNSAFNFISNSYVQGEWIEDVDPPSVKKIQQGEDIWISVTVKGRVREIKDVEVKFTIYSLSCADLKCQTQKFNDGQDLYLYFKSPEDGYLSCYLTDPETQYTFLLLPYKNSAKYKKCVPVKGDKDYIFFSKKFDYFGEKATIDEQVLSLNSGNISEKYQVWVLFSKEEIDKPVMEDESITTKKFLDLASINQGYTLPKGIASDKFNLWLQSYRVHNKKVQLSTIFVDLNRL